MTNPLKPVETGALKVTQDEFTRGYLIAISDLISGFGASTQSKTLLETIGADDGLIRSFGFTEYDIKNLSEGLRDMEGAI